MGYWYSLDQLFKSRWTLPAHLFLGLQSLTTWCYSCPSPTCNMCGHSHIEKTHLARLFCWTWTKICRGLQNHPVSSYCTTQALPGPGPHYWLFHRFTVFMPVTCSTSSVLHWVQSNCCCLQKKVSTFSLSQALLLSLCLTAGDCTAAGWVSLASYSSSSCLPKKIWFLIQITRLSMLAWQTLRTNTYQNNVFPAC